MDLLKRVLWLLPYVAAGCFNPQIAEGTIVCGESGFCPPGFECGPEGTCVNVGGGSADASVDSYVGEEADAAESPDALVEPPDARPGDVVPHTIYGLYGGGGSSSDKDGNTLHVTVGQCIDSKSEAEGGPSIEWGLLSSIKVEVTASKPGSKKQQAQTGKRRR